MEPHIKCSCASMASQENKKGGLQMTRYVLMVACALVLVGFAGTLKASAPRHSAVETLSPSAMMQDTRSLPVEAYDAI